MKKLFFSPAGAVVFLLVAVAILIFGIAANPGLAEEGAFSWKSAPRHTMPPKMVSSAVTAAQAQTDADLYAGPGYDDRLDYSTPVPTARVSSNTGAAVKPTATPVSKVKVTVLGYHSVNNNILNPQAASMFVRPAEFDAQMKYLRDNGYTVIGFDKLADADKIQKPVVITFDDGFLDNYTAAYPVLKKYGQRAVVFITSNFIGKKDYVTPDQIRSMTDVFDIGAHTLSHPPMSQLSREAMVNELTRNNEDLKKITGAYPVSFAFPYTDSNALAQEVASQYYQYICTTYTGLYTTGADTRKIERVYVPRGSTIEQFKQRLDGKLLK